VTKLAHFGVTHFNRSFLYQRGPFVSPNFSKFSPPSKFNSSIEVQLLCELTPEDLTPQDIHQHCHRSSSQVIITRNCRGRAQFQQECIKTTSGSNADPETLHICFSTHSNTPVLPHSQVILSQASNSRHGSTPTSTRVHTIDFRGKWPSILQINSN
jgi:hypothetical protein